MLKQTLKNHRKLWTSLIAVLLAAVVGVTLYLAVFASGQQVTNKITKEQAQQIVDDTFGGIAKDTAQGAKVIMDACSIKVNSIEYGDNKDVILDCSYEALDLKSALMDHIDEVMEEAYIYHKTNEDAGKKTNEIGRAHV